MSALRGIASILIARWLITLIGTLAIAALVWFLGPSLAFGSMRPLEGELARVIVIALVLLAWGFGNLLAERRAARTNKEMIQGLTAPANPLSDAQAAEQTASAEEIAVLEQRLQDALTMLKKVGPGGRDGRRYLYQIPWYLMIGPPGSGKTTALLNAGLVFPVAEKFGRQPLRGVSGTRNCEWLFTDQAILIDTAGRYTTQDSREAVDNAAWLGFLDLLGKFRPRQPINGVLVAISLPDLVSRDSAERLTHARAIRQRLRELHERFQIRFPIYVLFTKADLIAGFVEFFDDLGREGREQAWGMTFPLDPGTDPEGMLPLLSPEFDRLVDRLNDRMIERMQAERDIGRRSLIFGFPAQVASTKPPIEEFLTEIFHPTRFEQRPLLRGVYFTSGTQQGTPIDRLMGAIVATFGLERDRLTAFSGTGRSYFLNRLLRGVVFPEAGVVSSNPRLEQRQAWGRRTAYATAAAVLLAATGAWYTSYAANQRLIGAVDREIPVYLGQIAPFDLDVVSDADIRSVVPALNTLRDLPTGHADQESSASLLTRFGLYQGDKLGEEAVAAYGRGLNGLLLPRLLIRLQNQLRANMQRPDYIHEALKVYLMLGNQGPMSIDLVRNWMKLDWQVQFPGRANDTLRDNLDHHLDALLSGPLAEVALDAQLVEQSRRTLAQLPLAARAYALIRQSAHALRQPDWRISDHGGPAVDRVFTRASGKPLSEGVPGLYTVEGFRGVLQPVVDDVARQMADESWVLGNRRAAELAGRDIDRLERDILSLYADDYAGRWTALLADIAIVPLNELSQAVEVLNILAGPNSPMRQLLGEIARQTILTEPPPAPASAAPSSAAPPAVGRPLTDIVGATAPVPTTPSPLRFVDERFRPLHEFVQGREGMPPPIDETLRVLNDVYLELNKIAGSTSPGQIILSQASSADRIAAAQRLRTAASRLPEPVARMVAGMGGAVSTLTSGGARRELNQKWRADVLPLCTRAIEGRYPFDKRSQIDVSLEDFGRLFAPGGLIDGFFTDNLAAFVDTSRVPWRWQHTDTVVLGMSASTLVQFQRAATIRDAFFPGGSKEPTVGFDLAPLSLDASATQVLLDIGGQTLSYAHGPTQSVRMKWPGSNGSKQVRLAFSPTLGGQPSSITKAGTWAWFRLFDEAAVQRGALPDRFEITLTAGNRRASFDLRAESVINPFALQELGEFRCPGSL